MECQGVKAEEARAAGAHIVGTDDLVKVHVAEAEGLIEVLCHHLSNVGICVLTIMLVPPCLRTT